ncbi:aquaporin-4 [Corythoichthys intestinalis]|uniref:aquaporin-4 n=1 Tax=Corythoichthys intestinalis TaxID=161448 RepID=UPI0025A51D35|nr:aquaporin-4 [Corythoichthys intestinalis]
MPDEQSRGTIGGSRSNVRATMGSSSRPSAPGAASILMGTDKIGSKEFWRAVSSEFMATLLFVFISLGSTTDWHSAITGTTTATTAPTATTAAEASASTSDAGTAKPPPSPDHRVVISLCFGLTIATMVQCFGHISGGHINPAVTAAMLVTKKVSVVKGLLYIVAQMVGAIAGSGFMYLVTPTGRRGALGVCKVQGDLTVGHGLLVELLLTLQLVFTIFATCDAKRTDLSGSASLAIGLSVTIGHLFGIPYTGASMNPARSFGPAVVTGNFDQHWVYWVGPVLGAVVAGLLYEFLFCPDGKPGSGQVIPKDQMGAYRDMELARRKKRTERKDAREVLSTV